MTLQSSGGDTCRWLPMFWRNLLPPSSWKEKEVLVCIDQPTQWCHIPQGHSLNIHLCTDLKSLTFTALMTYLIHNVFKPRCHAFITDIKQMRNASVPDRRKRINCQLRHILFSLSKGLATCFRLNQLVMRPLCDTNSRYNKIKCKHIPLIYSVQHIPHQNYHYNKTFNSKRCGIPQENTTKVLYVDMSLHYTCHLSCVRSWLLTDSIWNM